MNEKGLQEPQKEKRQHALVEKTQALKLAQLKVNPLYKTGCMIHEIKM